MFAQQGSTAADQKFIPEYAQAETAEQLAERHVQETRAGIETTGVRPGVIKTGVNRATPLPDIERKLVSAALIASKQTGLTVASHTGGGIQALEQLSIAEQLQVDPSRLIWVHAQNERDRRIRLKAAREGMWVEFDGLRERTVDRRLSCVLEMAEAGLLNRTLISHDAGWYRPGAERGAKYRGYTFVFERFLPRLQERGVSSTEIGQLLIENPAAALSIE